MKDNIQKLKTDLKDSDYWKCQFCGEKTCVGGHNFEPFDYDYVCFNCSVGYYSCCEDKYEVKIEK